MKRPLNEFSEQATVNLPSSVVRTVSLSKLRQGSPLSERRQKAEPQPQQTLVQKLLNQKLGNQKGKENASKTDHSKRLDIKQFDLKSKKLNPTETALRANIFFENQQNYVKKKEDKMEQMRQVIQANRDRQNRFTPNENKRQRKASQTQGAQVYDRLYDDARQKNSEKNSMQSRKDSVESCKEQSVTQSRRFKGLSRGLSSRGKSIQLNNGKETRTIANETQQSECVPLQTKSVQLTARKQSNPKPDFQEVRQRRQSRKSKRMDLNINSPVKNQRQEQLCVVKMLKELKTIAEKCKISLALSYLQMGLLFQKYNLIGKDCSSQDRQLLFELWEMLGGDAIGYVSMISLFKVVFAIMGVHHVDLVNRTLQQSWLYDPTTTVQFSHQQAQLQRNHSYLQNILMLSQSDSKYVKKKYQSFYLTKLNKGQSFLKKPRQQQCSFKPQLSKNTTELASKYRQRVICQTERLKQPNTVKGELLQNGQFDHISLLLMDHKRKQDLLNLKQEEIKQTKRLQEQSIKSHRQPKERGSDRNVELYQSSKEIPKKKDRLSDEILEERWKDELTFKPNLVPNKNRQTQKKQIPHYEKAVYRMLQARKSKPDVPKNDIKKSTTPLLYLNVNIEEGEFLRVPVYSNDNMKMIVQKIRILAGIDSKAKSQRLEEIVRGQIRPAMEEMGMLHVLNS